MARLKSNVNWVGQQRERIVASGVEKRLIEHVFADPESKLMTNSQVSAAIALLKKVIPDLSATELTGADGASLFSEIERKIVGK